MNQKPTDDQDWIKPLLEQLDLVRDEAPIVDPNSYWTQLEKSGLSERIGRVVADINQAAGQQILEILDFLPPQETALRVTFTRRSCRHHMELILDESGAHLVFSTSKRGSVTLERYFPTFASKPSCAIAWEGVVHPSETPDTDIRAWLSFLLSGLDRSFRPDVAPQSITVVEKGFSSTQRKEASA